MLGSVKRLKIFGLHSRQDIEIEFDENVSIFMGPNGVGKSTVLNIFVHFLSRQWIRLAKQSFNSVEVEFMSGDIARITKEECSDIASGDFSPRIQSIISSLAEAGILEEILSSELISEDIYKIAEKSIGAYATDIRVIRRNISQSVKSPSSIAGISRASRAIKDNVKSHILYLPTYRRIEQDLGEILATASSASMRRIQAEISESLGNGPDHYTELVRFGMEDIKELIDSFTSDIKEYSRQQINSLSTRYLTAALRRQPFERGFFEALTDIKLRDVLARVDDEELNATQRKGISELIRSLRQKQGSGRRSRSQEHIGSYFYMLAETHERISRREVSLKMLASILNKYIGPAKIAEYDQTKYEFTIKSLGVEIPLSGLSSGEKQLISLFATLLLSKKEEYLIVIDEPELSLSVLWQERLIEDIISVESCKSLIAVTHSPFIYGEKLAHLTRDLNDHTKMIDIKNG